MEELGPEKSDFYLQALTETLDETAVECSPAEATLRGQQLSNVTGALLSPM